MSTVRFSYEEIVREGKFSPEDMAEIAKRRRDNNRLGFAYQLALKLFAIDTAAETQPFAEELGFLLKQVETGSDNDGNGVIDALTGEGGTTAVYENGLSWLARSYVAENGANLSENSPAGTLQFAPDSITLDLQNVLLPPAEALTTREEMEPMLDMLQIGIEKDGNGVIDPLLGEGGIASLSELLGASAYQTVAPPQPFANLLQRAYKSITTCSQGDCQPQKRPFSCYTAVISAR